MEIQFCALTNGIDRMHRADHKLAYLGKKIMVIDNITTNYK